MRRLALSVAAAALGGGEVFDDQGIPVCLGEEYNRTMVDPGTV
ncbi:hypothetical protein ACKI1J_47295 [Streptomyces scabiei]